MTRAYVDRCPGVLRPWIAEDGALIRLRLIGGALPVEALRGLAQISADWADGNILLTKRANLQLRGIGHVDGCLPAEFIAAISATGLLPTPSHELVRNIMISPLTGRTEGHLDVRPIAHELDALLCGDAAFAGLAGRFLFVLDDGRGDLVDRHLDLGLMAVDSDAVQLRIGSHIWGPIVPPADAAELLLDSAARFLSIHGNGDSALWHIDELPAEGAELLNHRHARDLRTQVVSLPPPYGRISQVDGLVARHLEVPDGVLTHALIDEVAELAGPEVIVTPWRSIIVPDLESA